MEEKKPRLRSPRGSLGVAYGEPVYDQGTRRAHKETQSIDIMKDTGIDREDICSVKNLRKFWFFLHEASPRFIGVADELMKLVCPTK